MKLSQAIENNDILKSIIFIRIAAKYDFFSILKKLI